MYLEKITAAAQQLVRQGFLLEADVPQVPRSRGVRSGTMP